MKTPIYVPLLIFTLFISLNLVEFYLLKDKTLINVKISTDSFSTKLENGCNIQGYEISNYVISPCIFNESNESNESNYSFNGYDVNGFSIPVSYYYNQTDDDNWYTRILIALIKTFLFFIYMASFLFSIQPKKQLYIITLLVYFLALICITIVFSVINLVNINMHLDHTICSVVLSIESLNTSCSVLDLSTQNKWFMQPCLLDIEESGIIDCYYNDINHFPLTANYFDKNKSTYDFNIFIFSYLLINNFTPFAIMVWYVKYKKSKEIEMTEYNIIEEID